MAKLPKTLIEGSLTTINDENEKENKKKRKRYNFNNGEVNKECKNLEKQRRASKQGSCEIENNDLKISKISWTGNEKRKWDKRFVCLFCSKAFTQLPKHWYRKHSNEVEVARILSLEKNSSQRNILIADLQNKAVFKQNTQVITGGEGEIVT